MFGDLVDEQFRLSEAAMQRATKAHVKYQMALNKCQWGVAEALRNEIVSSMEASLDLMMVGYKLAEKAGYGG